MDPVSVLVAALLAGCSAGISDAASTAVRDAYAGLRDAVRRRLTARAGPHAPDAVDVVLADPIVECDLLKRMLSAAGIRPDDQVVAYAERLLQLTDPDGSASGKYVLDLRAAKGVQVGDQNSQTNYFS
jgi:hypothetical protein